MYNFNDILAELQNGATASEIANGFTEEFNKAIRERNRLEAEAEAKRLEEEKKEKAEALKLEKAQAIIDASLDLIKTCYPDIWDESMANELHAEDLVKVMDKEYKQTKMIMDAARSLGEVLNEVPSGIEKATKEDPIDAFLKRNQLF